MAGFLANLVFSPSLDYADGVLLGMIVYFVSYYFARYVWYKNLDRKDFTKLYTTGIGGFIMFFLFTWILAFTLVA